MRASRAGVSVVAIKSDAAMEVHSGIATFAIMLADSIASMNTVGTNTTMLVSVPAVIAMPTSVTPRSAASNGVSRFCRRCRAMDSETTTELSTKRPTASISPTSESTFNVSPAKYITPKVATSAIGTVAEIRQAGVSRRMKANSTMAESRPPIMPFWARSRSASTTTSDSSLTVRNAAWANSGSLRMRSISAWTSAATPTKFASGFL